MNVMYLAAGALAVGGAAIHGGAGESLVLRKIDPAGLPRTRWGGGRATLRLLRGTWHMVTISFASFGMALSACGTRESSLACTGVARLGAATFLAFATIAVAGPLMRRSPRSLIRHPAPLLLSAVALLTWLGMRA